MEQIVKVAVPRPIWNTYDYLYSGKGPGPEIGARVKVPLGHSRATGVVIDLPSNTTFALKPLGQVIDKEALLPPDLIELAQWMSEYYHYPLGSVYETMLPSAARKGHSTDFVLDRLWKVTVDADLAQLSRAHKQRELFELIRDQGPMTDSQIRAREIPKARIDTLFEKGLIEEMERPDEVISVNRSDLTLTPEQNEAVQSICDSAGVFNTFLLDGVTGSGKTEVYLQVIEEVLNRGQQALILVPEISLTPQTTRRFDQRFGKVETLHSMVPDVQRFKIWYETATGRNPILVGTRSAVFTPFKDLGVIIVDEEHDTSFKQMDTLRYSARDVALVRAQNLNIPCVLGSATPSLESLVNVERERFKSLRLSHRPGTAEMPTMHIQDMRRNPISGGICEPLLERMESHVAQDGQVLILINRRGFLPSYFCTECGWKALCTDCDSKLVYHEQPYRVLQCHKCSKEYQVKDTCPACGEASLVGSGTGTQLIESTLRQRFPEVPIFRVDRDNIRTHRRLTVLFAELEKSRSGILIGTQMLAKGHHFPNVTMVAVIGADGGFLSTDFRGPERTAQLIVQVAGRAGRAERRGEVWIQTFDPDNPDLGVLVQSGYAGFAKSESHIRRSAGMPPYQHMALLRADGTNSQTTEDFIVNLMSKVEKRGIETLGPILAPVARISKRYRYQGALLSNNRSALHEVLKQIRHEKTGHHSIRWSIDVDPVDLY